MNALAGTVASYGLLANSTATVIGAMLMATLLGAISGVALALVQRDSPLLRESLTAKGHRFRTQSDTEVILHAYQEYGDRCVEHFNGQWAFALWDQHRERLFLSRDRFGIRPLFFTQTKNSFLFASEVKALFAGEAEGGIDGIEGIDIQVWHAEVAPGQYRVRWSYYQRTSPLPSANISRGTLGMEAVYGF